MWSSAARPRTSWLTRTDSPPRAGPRGARPPAPRTAAPRTGAGHRPAALVHRRGDCAGAGCGTAVAASSIRLCGAPGRARRRPGNRRSRARGPNALAGQWAPLAHARPRRAQRQGLQLGWPHPGTGGRQDPAAWSVRRHELERPQRGRNLRRAQGGRLVLPRPDERRVAAEVEIPRRQKHFQARAIGHAVGPDATQRAARLAGLWARAAGQVQEPARAVAGDPIAGAHAGRDRSARFLEVHRKGGRGLFQVRQPGSAESRGRDALEGAGPEMASVAQGFSARQVAGLGYRRAGRAVRSTLCHGSERPVSVEQPAGGTRIRARSKRSPGPAFSPSGRRIWNCISPAPRGDSRWAG